MRVLIKFIESDFIKNPFTSLSFIALYTVKSMKTSIVAAYTGLLVLISICGISKSGGYLSGALWTALI